MATKKAVSEAPSTEVAEVKKPATAIVRWEDELAKQAEAAAAQESSTSVGAFFSTKSGVLSFNDQPMPNNEMAVIILDSVFENVLYEGRYDPDNPTPPTCFAFGRDDSIKPHETVFEAGQNQSDKCKGCEHNEWGSAEVGRGKACSNKRRLALIPAGHFDRAGNFTMIEDDTHYQTAGLAFLKLPVTSVQGFAAYVKQISGALKRPPHGMLTRIKLVPDPKSQFKMTFEALDKVPDHLMPIVMGRHHEAVESIEVPYSLELREEEAPKQTRGKPPVKSKPAVKGRSKY